MKCEKFVHSSVVGRAYSMYGMGGGRCGRREDSREQPSPANPASFLHGPATGEGHQPIGSSLIPAAIPIIAPMRMKMAIPADSPAILIKDCALFLRRFR